jgi:hypothetical protein
MYADDHDNRLPDTLEPLKPYIAKEQDYLWFLDNVKYVLKEKKYFTNRPHPPATGCEQALLRPRLQDLTDR